MRRQITPLQWTVVSLWVLVGSCPAAWGQGMLENPAANSAQSGIGTISGWYCTATTIEAVIDDHILVPVAYGTPRTDTQTVCGDTNNGFALLINWADLGNGPHTVQLRANGTPFAAATVTVTTLGTAFLHSGNSKTTATLGGREVTLEWQESSQNFVVTGVKAGGYYLQTDVTSPGRQ